MIKNQLLNGEKKRKSYGNFSPQMATFQLHVQVQMCVKFCMVKIAVCMGRPSVQYDNPGAIPRNAVERHDFVEYGVFKLGRWSSVAEALIKRYSIVSEAFLRPIISK